MKKTAFLLMVLLAIVFQGSVDAQTALSRSVHVADGGLVFVTDVVPVASGTEVVRLGFPRDMLRNLAGYYLLDEEGQISTKVSNDVVWLEAAPKPSWKGPTISVVTVWRNLLVEAPQERYLLSVPANPIREKETAQLQLYLQIDGTASITSISGVDLQTSADKSKANGTISNIPQNQFKTLTAFFESPDLLVYVLEEANILVDLETKTVTADLVFTNLGNSAIASVDLKLGKTASVASARSGFVTLGTSWDGEKGILNVKLLQELQKNQKTRFQVVYASDAIFRRTADGIEVFPPNYVNASVSNYFLTIRTPPVSQISFSTEPWQLKVLDGDRREVTFKYTNIYVTSQQALTLRYVETFSIPVPAVLLVFIAFVAGFLVVRSVRTGKAGGEAAALNQF
ncbi:MAG: hypothetical protein NZ581_06970, partial [Candidatus Caldarchaeum sp.]|nr:hypothetical protein [Candidatus Caldarchaeum sp.]MDW8435919.1 hypothetical protein [Candidatus Caldarchaeum sp.]